MSLSAVLDSYWCSYQDIQALQAGAISVTGDRDMGRDSPDLLLFCQMESQQRFQAPGRLRHRRPKEQTTCYLINDFDSGIPK